MSLAFNQMIIAEIFWVRKHIGANLIGGANLIDTRLFICRHADFSQSKSLIDKRTVTLHTAKWVTRQNRS